MCCFNRPTGKDTAVTICPRASLDNNKINICGSSTLQQCLAMLKNKIHGVIPDFLFPFIGSPLCNISCRKRDKGGIFIRVRTEHRNRFLPVLKGKCIPDQTWIEERKI